MSCTWSDFLKSVMPDAPGCPEPVAERAIHLAAREFCRSVAVWVEAFAAVDMVSGQAEYAIAAPQAYGRVHAPWALFFDGQEMRPVAERLMNQALPGWRDETSNYATHYLHAGAGIVTLYPEPNRAVAGGLTGKVWLVPAGSASEGPDLLLDEWEDAVAHEAKRRLLAMPGKSWSNAGLVDYHRRAYKRELGRARIRAGQGRTMAGAVVAPPASPYFM